MNMRYGIILAALFGCGSTVPLGDGGAPDSGSPVLLNQETLKGSSCGPTTLQTPIGPIVGEVAGIDERDALGLYCRKPAHWPFDVKKARYTIAWNAAPCALVDHAFVAFPSSSPPAYAVGTGRVLPVSVAGFETDSTSTNYRTIEVVLEPPLRLLDGEAVCGGARLTVDAMGGRTCAMSCNGAGPDSDSFYSIIEPASDGHVGLCPETCHFSLLSISPDPQQAHAYGNDNRRFNVEFEGDDVGL